MLTSFPAVMCAIDSNLKVINKKKETYLYLKKISWQAAWIPLDCFNQISSLYRGTTDCVVYACMCMHEFEFFQAKKGLKLNMQCV